MNLRDLLEALENRFNAFPELRDDEVIVIMDGYNFTIDRVSDDDECTMIILELL